MARINPIYKPWNGHLEGNVAPVSGLMITIAINHLRPSGDDPPSSDSLFPSGWWLNLPIRKLLYSQIGLSPQVGLKIKDVWNHHPVFWPYIQP